MLATLSATRSDDLIDDGEATASALTSGYHLAFLIGAALVRRGDRRRAHRARALGAAEQAELEAESELDDAEAAYPEAA